MVYMRLMVEFIYVFLFAATGYFMFFIWKPDLQGFRCELLRYLEYLFAVSVSITFWGVIVLSIANATGNIWKGIGAGLVLWLYLLSTFGNKILGRYNIFAYALVEADSSVASWIPGKMIGLLIAGILGIFLLPRTLEFRRD